MKRLIVSCCTEQNIYYDIWLLLPYIILTEAVKITNAKVNSFLLLCATKMLPRTKIFTVSLQHLYTTKLHNINNLSDNVNNFLKYFGLIRVLVCYLMITNRRINQQISLLATYEQPQPIYNHMLRQTFEVAVNALLGLDVTEQAHLDALFVNFNTLVNNIFCVPKLPFFGYAKVSFEICVD